MSVTSDEVNYLVYRYLLESGFSHSTFAFQQETAIHRADIKGSSVKPGALISYLQKGLQYAEVESHLNSDGTEKRCLAPFHLIGNHVCDTLDELEEDEEDPLQELKKLKKQKHRDTKQRKKKREVSTSVDPFGTDMDLDDQTFPNSAVTELIGHTSEVFVCSWHPHEPLLATGSGDGTARIWDLSDPSNPSVVLPHSVEQAEHKDVTTLEWNNDGSLIGTGSYDGLARVWTKLGVLKYTLDKHTGPIFSLKWNKQGNLLLTGSVDKSAIVWDVSTGEPRQQFEFHSAPTLDVDWKDDFTFATCSTDQLIFVCQLGSLEPLRQFSGHIDEVNAIKWDPSGTYLASCSDDTTAKIWVMDRDEPLWEFKEHTKEIYTMKWSPSTSEHLLLATASFDSTIRLWDVVQGSCVMVLDRHSEAVYSVSFSPDALYLASGSFDQCIFVWSVVDGALIKSYQGQGGVFEVAFNNEGNKIAACYSDQRVVVLDVELVQ